MLRCKAREKSRYETYLLYVAVPGFFWNAADERFGAASKFIDKLRINHVSSGTGNRLNEKESKNV